MVERKYSVPAGLFARINTTQAAGGSRVFERPMHVIERIDEIRYERRRNNTDAVAILKTVLHVFSAPTHWSGGKKGQQIPMPQPRIGDQYTEYFTLDKDWAWPQLKTAIGMIFGADPESVQDENVADACSEGQPGRGYIVESQKIERESKSSPTVYTRCNYIRQMGATEFNELAGGCEASVVAYGGAEKLTADIEAEAAKS